MFVRVFSMFMAMTLLLTALVSGLCWVSMRERQISTQLQTLKKAAREVAYLAALSGLDSYLYMLGGSSAYHAMLSHQAEEIYEEFGAYILVVDRYGNVLDNMRSAYRSNPEFIESMDSEELSRALQQVLRGEEVSVKLTLSGKATFTVGVPYVQENQVLGAVLIQTPARAVEAGTEKLLLPVVAVALGSLLAVGALLWLYLRRALRPLKQMSAAASRMSEGDFSVRAPVDGVIPELRELGAAFNAMSGRLAETERSRREFVANVSHELRSPMTSITGFVEGMRDGTIPPQEHERYLAVVSQESRRLNKLISDLLALSRLEREDAALTWSDFDICEMLRRALIRRMGDLDARSLATDCDFQRSSMLVHADSDRIEQVVINLLDNAIRFTPDGGKIRLGCRERAGLCVVTVADTGLGVAPENRERIFERFFTEDKAHTAGKGTGLGLSICRRILQMHGQTIGLDDTEEGASFSFTLAMAEGRNGHDGNGAGQAAPGAGPD